MAQFWSFSLICRRFRKESVDRNKLIETLARRGVALRKESVDRNCP